MATMTAAEMADRVLENLGIKAAGESASAEDATLAIEAVTSVRAELVRDGIAQWAADVIPEWAQLPVRDLVSFELRNAFGLAGERRAAIESAYGPALAKLQRQTAGKHDPRVRTVARYY